MTQKGMSVWTRLSRVIGFFVAFRSIARPQEWFDRIFVPATYLWI